MANTFSCLSIHCVFSTKERVRVLNPDIRERLWLYMGGIAKQNGMIPKCVNLCSFGVIRGLEKEDTESLPSSFLFRRNSCGGHSKPPAAHLSLLTSHRNMRLLQINWLEPRPEAGPASKKVFRPWTKHRQVAMAWNWSNGKNGPATQ